MHTFIYCVVTFAFIILCGIFTCLIEIKQELIRIRRSVETPTDPLSLAASAHRLSRFSMGESD